MPQTPDYSQVLHHSGLEFRDQTKRSFRRQPQKTNNKRLRFKTHCKMIFFTLAASFFYLEIIGASNDVAYKEKWGYVNVTKNGNMFWWLYYTDQEDYADRPLVLWIQGGPGSSGTGLGNFLEIGPLDQNLQPRNATWLTKANLLFLDSPVGTGFSYVTDKSALVRNNAEIAEDLLYAFYSILQEVPEFKKSPLYIVAESYGGKVTVDFALVLDEAIERKSIECNFKGIALGDSWISPYDQLSTWGDFLYTMSLLDDTEHATVNDLSAQIRGYLDREQYTEAEEQYSNLTDLIDKFTNNGDWYNILKTEGPNDRGCSRGRSIDDPEFDKLDELMNGPIRQKLGIIPENVTWSLLSDDVFEALKSDYMKGVLPSVDNLLTNHSHIGVTVYNGQLDQIVTTLGVLKWINKLKWPGLKEFQAAPKEPITFPGNRTAGFSKVYKQFGFITILFSGHYLPYDAPDASILMLDKIMAKKCSTILPLAC